MMGRKKELMEQLNSRDETIRQLRAELDSVNARMIEYQQREAGVVAALTDAEAAAAQKIAVAQQKADAILATLELQKQEAEQDASSTRERAATEAQQYVQSMCEMADATLENAKMEAQAILAQAETSIQAYRTKADRLNAQLLSVAEQAERDAAAFQNAMLELRRTVEHEDVEAPQIKPVETPEEYTDPAALMHSIYAIQGRDIPATADDTVDPAPETEESTAMQEPAAEENELAEDAAPEEAPAEQEVEAEEIEIAEDAAPEDTPAEQEIEAEEIELAEDAAPEDTPAEQAIEAEESELAEEAAPEETPAEQEPGEPERLWTVDEIIASVIGTENSEVLSPDAELDKLIEDILH